jgi:hypothetical protein
MTIERYASSPTNSAIKNWAVHCRFLELATLSALRISELNALTSLCLLSQPLHFHSEIFFFRFSSALRHATYRTTSRIGIKYEPNEKAMVKE